MTTTISVSRDTRDRLAKFGRAGDSLNDALMAVLNIAEESLCEAIATCAVCGRIMSSKEYGEKGCIYCGADSS
jgi:hypothetical protein